MATQWTGNVSDGQILTAAKLQEIGATGNSYTPAWTATTTNPILNNGTIAGNWVRINKWVFGQIFIVVGSFTNVGAGFYRFSVPVAISGNSTLSADLHLLDGSAGYQAYNGFGIPVVAGGTTIEFRTHGAGTFTQAVPIPLGNTDQIRIRFFYEAA